MGDFLKLWTHDFINLYISNFLLYTCLYMLLPVLPIHWADEYGISFLLAGLILSSFGLSIFLFGPLYSYLIDAYKRKYICVWSFLAIIAITVSYAYVNTLTGIIFLRIFQGTLFGVTLMALGSTLAIDITAAARRSEANNCFAWAGRLGIILGPAIGLFIFYTQGFEIMLYSSAALGILGILLVSSVHVAFRAPIGSPLFSSDRFWLFKGWVPAFNMILIASAAGILIININSYLFYIWVAGGFVLSVVANRWIFKDADMRAQVMSGMILIGTAFLLLLNRSETAALVTAACLLGMGFGLVASYFLTIFVNLSQHCQRGTANTTYLFSWEAGIALGIIVGAWFKECFLITDIYLLGLGMIMVAIIFYLSVTNPYYLKNKIR